MASVKMPQLGESITEGTISKWLKQPGDQVKKYEGLVEIITDKVNAEVPAPLSGVLKEIKVKEGATVTVGTEIAVIEETAAATPSAPKSQPAPQAATPQSATPIAAPAPAEESATEGQGGGSTEGRTRLSPAVRALIEEHRISDAELARIEGSGIGGRISKSRFQYVLKSVGDRELQGSADRLMGLMRQDPIFRDVSSEGQEGGLRAFLNVDRERAGRAARALRARDAHRVPPRRGVRLDARDA